MTTVLGPSTTYVCLLSDNVLPNVIPLADPHTRPGTVILVMSPGHEERAQWFQRATDGWGLNIRAIMGDPYSYDATHRIISGIVQEYGPIVINVTGGTKLMALAAFDVCHGHYPVMYVDSRHHTIQVFDPAIGHLAWPPDLKVKQYLASYGYQVQAKGKQNTSAAWRQVGDALVAHRPQWHRELTKINWIASVRQNNFRQPMELASTDMVCLLRNHGLIQATENQWQFISEAARQFLNGGWFEAYVFSRLRHMQQDVGITGLTTNIVVRKGGVQNELDIVFVLRNHLHIIECKTKHFDRDGTLQQAHPVYKLDSILGRVGGLMGKALLISYHPMTASVRQRCQDLHIAHIDTDESIDAALMEWIQSK